MKYDSISPSLFSENRKRYIEELPERSVAIFHSNEVFPSNADAHHRFEQNSDLFYLSGIDQEESILVIAPGQSNPEYREMLFLKRPTSTLQFGKGTNTRKKKRKRHLGLNRSIGYLDTKAYSLLSLEKQNMYSLISMNTTELLFHHLGETNVLQMN